MSVQCYSYKSDGILVVWYQFHFKHSASNKATMNTIVILFLSAFLCGALAEPLRYRAQQVRASARQTDAGVAVQAELGDNAQETNDDQDTQQNDEQVTESSFSLNAPAPRAYYPQGWRPFGQLLVLPVAVRENFESTTTVESTTFNDAETTTEIPTTTDTPRTSGQLQEVETSEPKIKKTASHKRPTVIIIKGKKIGELKLETTEETKEEPKKNTKDESKEDSEESVETSESNEADSTTTESADEASTTTDPKSENLETTSEPDSEAVDVEKSNEEGKQSTNTQDGNPTQFPAVPQTGFFIQLPDGSFQRIVYAQTAFNPQPVNTQIQQLNQTPNYPFGFNPISNPRIVTFSTQYNAW